MTIAEQLKAAIVAKGLTPYSAAQFIAGKTKCSYKTVYRQLTSLASNNPPPKTIQILEKVCDTLGLTISISINEE